MRTVIINLVSATFIFLSTYGYAQANLKIGREAPEITITEWISNKPTDTNLKNKYIVLDFWATWCKPCLEAVPHMNSLQEKFSSENIAFLSMTDETKKLAQTVFDQVDFQTAVVTDEYGQTQINFGDGVKGLAYYPMTVLIDDQNIVRWYGSSDNLTENMIQDFLDKKPINVKQMSTKSPLSKKQDIELSFNRKFDLKRFSDMFHDPNILWLVNIEEVQDSSKQKEPNLNMGIGAYYNPISLIDLLTNLFPHKRFVIPEYFSNKKYGFTYLDKVLDSESEDRLLQAIINQLDLTMERKEEKGVKFVVKIKDKSLLTKSTAKGFDGFRKNDSGDLVFQKKTIMGMLRTLSSKSDYYWTLKSKDKNKYAFEIIMTSVETINNSLKSYGLKVIEESGKIDTLYFSKKK